MKIKMYAAGKLMLLGEHAVVYNRPCLVMAVDKSLTIAVSESKTRSKNESVFAKAVIDKFSHDFGEIKVKIKTIKTFGSEYGLGSSATVTVALAKALFKLKQIKVGQKELFDFVIR